MVWRFSAFQCLSLHLLSLSEMKQRHTLFYQPYNQLERMTDAHVTARTARLLDIEEYLRKAEWYNARLLSKQLITDALEGLRYLQTYDRFLIRSIVTAAYTGFALYSSLYIFQPQETLSPRSSATVSLTATVVLLTFWGLFAMQKSPWTFYIYAAFPCYFWQQFAIYAVPALRLWIRSRSHGSAQYLSAAMRGALVIATLQGMVVRSRLPANYRELDLIDPW
jgi:GPI ethanolamine phosphate transferase 1